MGGWIRNWRAKFKVHQMGLSRYLVVSKHSQNTNCRSRKDLSVPYQLCTLYTFLTGRGGELFANTWVGWEGWGPLTDTHLSDIELFTTLFIQDKQLPPPLDFFYWAQVSTYRCLMAKTKCWKWYSSVVWMSVLNLMVTNICRGYLLLSVSIPVNDS